MVEEEEYNKLLLAWNELNNENIYLKEENEKAMRLVEKRTEECNEEFFTILGNIKLLLKKQNYDATLRYVNEQYQILKKELFHHNQVNE